MDNKRLCIQWAEDINALAKLLEFYYNSMDTLTAQTSDAVLIQSRDIVIRMRKTIEHLQVLPAALPSPGGGTKVVN